MSWSPSLQPADIASALSPTLTAPSLAFKFVPRSGKAPNERALATPSPVVPRGTVPLPFTPASARNLAIPRPWLGPIGPGPFDPWADQFIKGMQGLTSFFRGRSRARRRDDDENECDQRFYREQQRCFERWPNMAADFRGACIERAKQRRNKCKENGSPGGPGELPEWGDDDEEIWLNFGR